MFERKRKGIRELAVIMALMITLMATQMASPYRARADSGGDTGVVIFDDVEDPDDGEEFLDEGATQKADPLGNEEEFPDGTPLDSEPLDGGDENPDDGDLLNGEIPGEGADAPGIGTAPNTGDGETNLEEAPLLDAGATGGEIAASADASVSGDSAGKAVTSKVSEIATDMVEPVPDTLASAEESKEQVPVAAASASEGKGDPALQKQETKEKPVAAEVTQNSGTEEAKGTGAFDDTGGAAPESTGVSSDAPATGDTPGVLAMYSSSLVLAIAALMIMKKERGR